MPGDLCSRRALAWSKNASEPCKHTHGRTQRTQHTSVSRQTGKDVHIRFGDGQVRPTKKSCTTVYHIRWSWTVAARTRQREAKGSKQREAKGSKASKASKAKQAKQREAKQAKQSKSKQSKAKQSTMGRYGHDRHLLSSMLCKLESIGAQEKGRTRFPYVVRSTYRRTCTKRAVPTASRKKEKKKEGVW